MHRLLGLADGNRRVLGDPPRRRECGLKQGIKRHDLVHESPVFRLCGGEGLAGEDDLFGAAYADGARQI